MVQVWSTCFHDQFYRQSCYALLVDSPSFSSAFWLDICLFTIGSVRGPSTSTHPLGSSLSKRCTSIEVFVLGQFFRLG